ncbi:MULTISPECIES: hypothetical protein [Streptomyces]|uniref:Secreted protein n=1 Tax=Streptomyces flavovirens TaxID=52258 RepID=A0ABV8N332_9ACTN|nr:hypothetical protein [Streptomyces sp. MBT51]
MPDTTPTRPRPRLLTLPLTVFVAAVAIGVGAWFLFGAQAGGEGERATCADLTADKQLQNALAERHRSDMSCADLGGEMKRAAMADGPDEGHTREQAAAMKNLILAVDHTMTDSGTPAVEAALRKPLAEALADHEDIAVLLSDPTESTYARNGIASRGPWEEDDGYHFSVGASPLLRVVRAVSEDPEAYAALRQAQTRWEAQRLAALPQDAEALRLTVGARALGKLDGVAADVRNGLASEDARNWDTVVFRQLTGETDPQPDADVDPAGRIEGVWRTTLTKTPEAEREGALKRQCAVMIAAGGEKSGGATTTARSQCLDNAAGNASRVTRLLSGK